MLRTQAGDQLSTKKTTEYKSFCKISLSLKRNLFFKSDDGHAISRQEKRWLPKSLAQLPARKSLLLPSGCLGTPFPLPRDLFDRTGWRKLTSKLNFLLSIGYQFFLPMVLRWRASRARAPLINPTEYLNQKKKLNKKGETMF